MALTMGGPSVFAYLNAHASAQPKAAAQTAGPVKDLVLEIGSGGIVFFLLLSIPLPRGRWRPRENMPDKDEDVNPRRKPSRPSSELGDLNQPTRRAPAHGGPPGLVRVRA